MKELRLPVGEYSRATDFWFKQVEFGQFNWALIEEVEEEYVLYFFDVSKGVFDVLTYRTEIVMKKELQLNGFERYEREAVHVDEPSGDFYVSDQADLELYSSGKFWKALPERLLKKYGEI